MFDYMAFAMHVYSWKHYTNHLKYDDGYNVQNLILDQFIVDYTF